MPICQTKTSVTTASITVAVVTGDYFAGTIRSIIILASSMMSRASIIIGEKMLSNCPKCGGYKIKIDSDYGLLHKECRIRCESCGAHTEWHDGFWASDAHDRANRAWERGEVYTEENNEMNESNTYTTICGEPQEINKGSYTYDKTTSGYIDTNPRQIPAGSMGWICPVCGRGLSPYTTVCPCQGYLTRGIEITC